MPLTLSKTCLGIAPSATLKMNALVGEMRDRGEDVISLSVGEPDFITPAHIREAGKKAIDEGKTRYTAAAGMPSLRSAIAKYLLEEKGLTGELVAEFSYVLIMSRESPIAKKEEITYQDLKPLIEIVHGDPYVPSLPVSIVKRAELPEDIERRIFLFERGGQFYLLVENVETFMWVSPLPQKLLERYWLVQRKCVDNTKLYRDVLIHKKDYKLTEMDWWFLEELKESKRRWLP